MSLPITPRPLPSEPSFVLTSELCPDRSEIWELGVAHGQCSTSTCESLGLSPCTTQTVSRGAHLLHNPSTGEAEVGGLGVRGILSYIVSSSPGRDSELHETVLKNKTKVKASCFVLILCAIFRVRLSARMGQCVCLCMCVWVYEGLCVCTYL